MAFGNIAVGQTGAKTLTVNNTGATNPLVISHATSSNPAEFAVTNGGTCGAIPVTLAAKTSCTLGVGFTPAAVGAHSATLTLTDNGGAGSQNVSLSGTGIAGLTTTKSSLVYGNVKFGLTGVNVFSAINHQTQPVSLSESFSGNKRRRLLDNRRNLHFDIGSQHRMHDHCDIHAGRAGNGIGDAVSR